jgi:uncharacterized membrane protein
MDKSFHSLDQHFHLPHIRKVNAGRPLAWLGQGWQDMRQHLGASLAYGLLFAALGYLLLSYAASLPYLFTAAISGFFLVGPLAAAGLYEISRRSERGEPCSLTDSLRGLVRQADSLLYFGLFLALVLIGWERLSAILFALLYPGNVPELSGFARQVFLSGEYTDFVLAYVAVGGILAVVVFTLAAVAVPMLMDRDTDAITAAMTSARAVALNPVAMAVWAVLIVVLMAIGFATMMIGMVILLPLLGHATWHAYRDLVGD